VRLALLVAVALFPGCRSSVRPIDKDPSLYRFAADGRQRLSTPQSARWVEVALPSIEPARQAELVAGLERHLEITERRGMPVEHKMSEELLAWAKRLAPFPPGLSAARLVGADAHANVQYTGYFSPVLNARRREQPGFRVPIYRLPKGWKQPGPHLSRAAIDDAGGLRGRGLEIAWVDDPVAVFFLHVQGSGLLRFADGSTITAAYAGKNGHRYVSIGRLLVERGAIDKSKISMRTITAWCAAHPDGMRQLFNQNPSYVFFRTGAAGPTGAAGEVVAALTSLAVDPAVIPLGSVLLGHVPQLDATGTFTGHRWRILLAQDTGGAIKGTAHIDLYTGIGELGAGRAQALHHYGRLLRLVPGSSSGD
jgi:membrane-bound lytic murein transglycosylase A